LIRSLRISQGTFRRCRERDLETSKAESTVKSWFYFVSENKILWAFSETMALSVIALSI
jgi:hypothetical protein